MIQQRMVVRDKLCATQIKKVGLSTGLRVRPTFKTSLHNREYATVGAVISAGGEPAVPHCQGRELPDWPVQAQRPIRQTARVPMPSSAMPAAIRPIAGSWRKGAGSR